MFDGNKAAAQIAKLSKEIAIYPITRATSMGKQRNAWAAARQP
jgi:pyruvate/2-oxoacid:ferredoxin oxidoreductase alpha subunit